MRTGGEETNPYAAPEAGLGGPRGGESGSASRRPRDDLRAAIRSGAVQAGVVLFLSALVLDGGDVFRTAVIASLATGAATLIVAVRRRQTPTVFDLITIRHGLWLFLLLTRVAAPVVWRLTGQSR